MVLIQFIWEELCHQYLCLWNLCIGKSPLRSPRMLMILAKPTQRTPPNSSYWNIRIIFLLYLWSKPGGKEPHTSDVPGCRGVFHFKGMLHQSTHHHLELTFWSGWSPYRWLLLLKCAPFCVMFLRWCKEGRWDDGDEHRSHLHPHQACC